MKEDIQATILSMVAMFYTASSCCNVIRYPAMFVKNIILGDFSYIILPSFVIKAILYYVFLKNITYMRALLISCIGNLISILFGTFLLGLSVLLWHEQFRISGIVITVLMCLGSAFMELLAIKLIFRYSFDDLWRPVFIGNLIAYAAFAYHAHS